MQDGKSSLLAIYPALQYCSKRARPVGRTMQRHKGRKTPRELQQNPFCRKVGHQTLGICFYQALTTFL